MDEKFLKGMQQMIVDGVVEGTVEGITEELNKVIQGKSNRVNGKKYMNQKETCEYLGISYPTLRRWMDEEGLEYSLIGGKQYMFNKDDIIDFVKRYGIKHLEK